MATKERKAKGEISSSSNEEDESDTKNDTDLDQADLDQADSDQADDKYLVEL